MSFSLGLGIGLAVGSVATLLYTPLQGRDARAILLGPLGWRELETEPASDWSPKSADLAEYREVQPAAP